MPSREINAKKPSDSDGSYSMNSTPTPVRTSKGSRKINEEKMLESVVNTLQRGRSRKTLRRRHLWQRLLWMLLVVLILVGAGMCIGKGWIYGSKWREHEPSHSDKRWNQNRFFSSRLSNPTSAQGMRSTTVNGGKDSNCLMLSSALQAFLDFPSVVHMQSLVRHSIQVSQLLLDQLPETEELQHLSLPVHEGQEWKETHAEPSPSSREQQVENKSATKSAVKRHPINFSSPSSSWDVEEGVGEVEIPLLMDSTNVIYAVLQSVLLSMPPPPLSNVSFSAPALPRTLGKVSLFPHLLMESPVVVSQWVLSALFILNHVLPEYFARHAFSESEVEKENRQNAQHLAVLLQSVNIEYWSQWRLVPSLLPPLTRTAKDTPSAICRALLEGVEKSHSSPSNLNAFFAFPFSVHQFCRKSFYSTAAIAQRIAANFEELIALHPRYGPFRLHYLAALWSWEAASRLPAVTHTGPSFTPAVSSTLEEMRRKLIQRERMRSEDYFYTDEYHVPLLRWMELMTFSKNSEDYRNTNSTSAKIADVSSHIRSRITGKEKGNNSSVREPVNRSGEPIVSSQPFPSSFSPVPSPENATTQSHASTPSLWRDVLHALPHCDAIMQPGLFPGQIRGAEAKNKQRQPHSPLSRTHSRSNHPTGDPTTWPGIVLMPLVQRPPLFTRGEVRKLMEAKQEKFPADEFRSFMSC